MSWSLAFLLTGSVSIHTLRNGENLHSLSNSLSILPVNGIE